MLFLEESNLSVYVLLLWIVVCHEIFSEKEKARPDLRPQLCRYCVRVVTATPASHGLVASA
jgi:hypothetical protein